jgi:hypothetical protein
MCGKLASQLAWSQAGRKHPFLSSSKEQGFNLSTRLQLLGLVASLCHCWASLPPLSRRVTALSGLWSQKAQSAECHAICHWPPEQHLQSVVVKGDINRSCMHAYLDFSELIVQSPKMYPALTRCQILIYLLGIGSEQGRCLSSLSIGNNKISQTG